MSMYTFCESMLKFVMGTCFTPSIRLLTKVLQIQEFVNMLLLGMLFLRDVFLINRTVPTSNADKSDVAYKVEKEHNNLL